MAILRYANKVLLWLLFGRVGKAAPEVLFGKQSEVRVIDPLLFLQNYS